MISAQLLVYLIKLVLGGIVAFLAILMLSKTKEIAWTFMVCGFLFSYAALVFDLLLDLGVLVHTKYCIYGAPLSLIISVSVPSVFFILGLICFIAKKD